MRVNSKDLHGAAVVTERGVSVGKLSSLDLDGDTGKLVGIRVAHRGITGLLSDELRVPWNSIVEMSAERVVILDTAVPAEARAIAKGAAANSEALLKEQGS